MRNALLVQVAALLLSGAAGVAGAQGDSAISIVVPAGPGSAPDIVARLIGDELRARLGVVTVIDNKSGAGGILAVMAAKTAASPNTLLLAQAAVATVTPLTYRAAKYDLERDMEPVAVIAETPMLFVANVATGPKDALGVGGAVLSVSTPGVHLGSDEEARTMARAVNEFAAEVAAEHPRRIGFFATLTLPDVDGALREAEHAFDVLKADGVVLLANVNGTYLGDAAMEPLMAELDRRAAVVFVHPSTLPAPPLADIPPFAADFLLDTTRAAIHMARRGWLHRYANVRIILSHAGGFLPYAAERVARFCSPSLDHADGLAALRRYWFDLALSSTPYALPSLLAFADPARITFGSDWPYAPKDRSAHFARLLDEYPLGEQQRRAIDRDNAAALFPRFGAAA